MLDHGGFPAEAFQAPIMGALVRALARVDAAMPCETRRLFAKVSMVLKRGQQKKGEVRIATYIRESFATANMLALVRLLASVCPDVYCESAPLDEALPTSRGVARVWPLVGVDTIMSLQV